MNHLNENDIVLLYYGESANHGEAVLHLEQCEQCRAEYDRVKDLLETVGSVPVPDLSAEQIDALWTRLRPQLETRSKFTRVSWIPGRRWAIAAGIAAGLLAAFMLGRFWPHTPLQEAAAPGANVKERILLVAVGDHLERSQMMLVELVNAKGDSTVDIGSVQARAEDLVAGNRLYRQTAAREGNVGVADVLDELERVLLTIAHSPSEMSSQQFEALRRNIESQGIILKVRIIGAKARESERPPMVDSLRPTI
jgi:hypothetical protein